MSPDTPQVATFGCRVNLRESDELRLLATEAGLGNAVIVNTCAVTAEAVRQGQQEIRRLARQRPGGPVVVTGCAAQIEPQRFAVMPEVRHVVGNAEKLLSDTWKMIARKTIAGGADTGGAETGQVLVGDIMAAQALEAPRLDAVTPIPRAFVQIQNGCDHRCTFCVIPFGRGRSRSLPAHAVVAQINAHVERGVPEVVLTGVDITSWGKDLPDPQPLGRLVRQILHEVPALARLRLSSLDNAEADDELLAVIAEEPRLMPHLHLSLQSGSDLILKRMKRRHRRADAIELARRLRRLRPGIALGADLIAGFPTETEQQFRETLQLVADCDLTFLHVFPYSVRPDTPAARMPQVPGDIVKERAARLREEGRRVLETWLGSLRGARIEVALERCGEGILPARSEHFAKAAVSGVRRGAAPGEVVPALVTGRDGDRLLAEAL